GRQNSEKCNAKHSHLRSFSQSTWLSNVSVNSPPAVGRATAHRGRSDAVGTTVDPRNSVSAGRHTCRRSAERPGGAAGRTDPQTNLGKSRRRPGVVHNTRRRTDCPQSNPGRRRTDREDKPRRRGHWRPPRFPTPESTGSPPPAHAAGGNTR